MPDEAIINPAELQRIAESFNEGFAVREALLKAAEEILRQRAYIDALHQIING